ncbi:PTS IIA-like nitrogen regulatory protein PtsN [Sphingomonas sp. S2-65]|uniref:PTS IIA-like nitrogen regulatory protein PtsN n=1 Tax=Sphingomonas sp. S2-65 TaxID=2903960 RepID=UPI001F331182|nr:PTS IIA-like nitrogen regulatory protein PtsN [Sphingomonas sp. S2-65]UYY57335.1 PTS IIA-like nitrogen regulatory protein PtsN [Sphingomonas sp. S2-65]
MTELSDLLTPEAVLAGVGTANKKTLFQHLGSAAARAYGLDPRDVTERLLDREKLGSTGFGGGIAIPHARLAGLPRVSGIFARLQQPVDFGAVDELPVDLVFMLLSPAGAGAEHLKALASVSRRLRDRTFAAKLRGAGSPDALYALLTGVEARDAA